MLGLYDLLFILANCAQDLALFTLQPGDDYGIIFHALLWQIQAKQGIRKLGAIAT